eukprot:CAMPEP_0117040698 /NCGR_PEP_ID=MMETSP0472-20121206/28455_1 /TAXON_ID=693140 ORGANISM="Tiarina fusus, Strain LIS" /NCGR_SAMPLE_ID=MMETSP0472 /ASSEMBLY_ACC=CAM_ASM_000603 /LENGTH=44 /DNA_ID= /DNA_START= /DNA_END= /DNA_ORIENTATION=
MGKATANFAGAAIRNPAPPISCIKERELPGPPTISMAPNPAAPN